MGSESSKVIKRYAYQLKSLPDNDYTGWVEVCVKELGLDTVVWREHRVNGLIHRDDGPAVIYYDENREWYWYGRKVSAEYVFDNLTPEQKEIAIWNMDEWK